jgi:hypothetical protein
LGAVRNLEKSVIRKLCQKGGINTYKIVQAAFGCGSDATGADLKMWVFKSNRLETTEDWLSELK